ncbi:LOW QUALITY PROTEIN: hypothetical protein QC761_602057 [Podospora bellae-mahoneyi]|uniref:Carbohydrate Esterase Family 3 n=1 Tax=Podospora bellae-mahoneyi TaxID=2093777 RepID=A0ABR0F954_9PEZI|nr:LOW QUALITY PROTEIN: hypothetical protein QC761_602057 [Podospora bellae-mahoneyi]
MKFNGASRRSHGHFVAIATLIFSRLALSTPGPVSNGQDGEQRVISDEAKHETQTSREKAVIKKGQSVASTLQTLNFAFWPSVIPSLMGRAQAMAMDSLRQAGYKVNMVGSKQHGLMNNNQVEARDKMDQVTTIHGLSKHWVKYQPNVILMHAGTFDTLMQNDLYETEYNYSMPAFGVITLDRRHLPVIRRHEVVADRLWVLEPERAQKIVLADMWAVGIGAAEFEVMGRHDFRSDGIHPRDSGYEKMASIFLRAIIGAGESGFLSPPRDSEHVEDMAETYGDDLDTFTVETQVSSPPIDENVMIYMAARATDMRGTGGKTPDDGIWSKAED